MASLQPVNMDLDDFRELKYGSSQVKEYRIAYGEMVRKIEAGLSQLSMSDFINIPGYQPQVLTFPL